MTTYTPRHEESGINFTVSTDFTGSNGDTDRTYSLFHASAVIQGMDVVVAGAALQNITDYTFTSNTLTFLNAIYDNQKVTIDYNTTSAASSSDSSNYASTDELNEFMVMKGQIPNPETVGKDRGLELVGTGDSSTTRFYVDNASIISSSYTFYYGSSEAVALSQPLTETTHFTLDADLGIFTLTTAGVTLVATSKVYAVYAYCKLGFSDTELQKQLARAEDTILKETSNHWATGTDDTPDYKAVSDEKQDGKGRSDRVYFLDHYPLPDVETALNGDVASAATSITVSSTQGFPSSGTLAIGNEKIVYSAKGTTTFAVTALTTAHTDEDSVLPFVIEISNTASGTEPSFTVLEPKSDYDLDLLTGRVYVYRDDVELSYLNTSYPPALVRNRFRASYAWGNESIPNDIKQLTLMIASKDILHRAVRKAHGMGLNDFSPSIVNIDEDWIKDTIQAYKNRRISNIG